MFTIAPQGSDFFIACEVSGGRYEFMAAPTPPEDPASASQTTQYSVDGEQGEFHHNPLHDMESLWWLAVYFLFHREVISGSESKKPQSEDDLRAQHNNARRLFEDKVERSKALWKQGQFKSYVESLHGDVYKVGRSLDRARRTLVKAYETLEMGTETVTLSFEKIVRKGVHSEFEGIFRDAVTLVEGVRIRPLTVLPEKQPSIKTTLEGSSKPSGVTSLAKRVHDVDIASAIHDHDLLDRTPAKRRKGDMAE